jgi:hypothetical protein
MARSAALNDAIAEVAPMFAQCPRCGRWRCHQHCWNANAGLCLDCAPYAAVPTPPAQPWGGVAQPPQAPTKPSGGYNAPYGALAQPSVGRVAQPSQQFYSAQPAYPAPQAYAQAPAYAPAQVVTPVIAPMMVAPVAVAYVTPVAVRVKPTGPSPLLVGLIGGIILLLLMTALYYISIADSLNINTSGAIIVIVAVISFLTVGFAAALRGDIGAAALAGLISGGIGSLGVFIGGALAAAPSAILLVGVITTLPLSVGAGAGIGVLGGLIGKLLYKG